MAKGKVYLAIEKHIRDGVSENKSELSVKMGMTPQKLYDYLSGKRIVEDNIIKLISNYFQISFENVKAEFLDNLENAKAKAGLNE